ncbi:MAG: glycosyltransferase [Planctomycetota bacterium]
MRILLVATYFGLDRATGAKRANTFARYWSRADDVEVTVLTARKPYYPRNPEGTVDYGDIREVRVWWPDPIGWRQRLVDRRRAKAPAESGGGAAEPEAASKSAQRGGLLRFLSDAMVTPDRETMWFLPAVLRGLFVPRPDIVVATAPSMSGLIVGRWIARLRRVPFVADLRDPWLTNPFRPERTGRLDRWDRRLEEFCMRGPREVWVTTETLRHELKQREHAPVTQPITVISNGFDEEEWRSLTPSTSETTACTILHSGSLYGVRTPKPLLDDIAAVASDGQGLGKCSFRFVGPIDPAIQSACESSLPNDELHARVHFEPPLSFEDSLRAQLAADVLLLVGHRTEEASSQIPMKLYEYLRAGKPILALFQRNSAVAQLAAEQPELGIHLLDLDDAEARRPIVRTLLDKGAEGLRAPDPSAVGKYDREALAAVALARLRSIHSPDAAAPTA